jgi:hypothetical protein
MSVALMTVGAANVYPQVEQMPRGLPSLAVLKPTDDGSSAKW